MSFEFHINGNQTTFFILFVLRSCTFGFADYKIMIEMLHRIIFSCKGYIRKREFQTLPLFGKTI